MIRNWQKQGMKNMVILVDTNIMLDFLTVRQPYYDDARNIIRILENDAFSDFEDCLQDECAQEISADYIVTRNIGDFQCSKVKAVTLQELFKIIESRV